MFLGQFATSVLGNRPWNDGYPARLDDAEELDKLLLFAKGEGQLDLYISRVRGKLTQRDEALNELRVAFYFQSSGYKILEWEPLGNGEKKGECSITQNGKDVIFVEVKSPGWEGVLDPLERDQGRKSKPKYIPGEHRHGAVLATRWPRVRSCITNAYPKFSPHLTNLLVIVDDFFVPLVLPGDRQIEIALYGLPDAPDDYGPGCFASDKLENLGGVACFACNLFLGHHPWEYLFSCYANPFALRKFSTDFTKERTGGRQ